MSDDTNDTQLLQEAIDSATKALREENEQLKAERDGALDFLRKGAYVHQEIVSTSRLTELQIANYRVAGLMYVEPGGGCGWVVRKIAPQIEWTEQADARWREAESRADQAESANRALVEALEAAEQRNARQAVIIGDCSYCTLATIDSDDTELDRRATEFRKQLVADRAALATYEEHSRAEGEKA